MTNPTNHPQNDCLANETLSKPQKTITRVEHDQKNVIVGYLVKGWENHETLPESLEVHIPQASLAAIEEANHPEQRNRIEAQKAERERNQTNTKTTKFLSMKVFTSLSAATRTKLDCD